MPNQRRAVVTHRGIIIEDCDETATTSAGLTWPLLFPPQHLTPSHAREVETKHSNYQVRVPCTQLQSNTDAPVVEVINAHVWMFPAQIWDAPLRPVTGLGNSAFRVLPLPICGESLGSHKTRYYGDRPDSTSAYLTVCVPAPAGYTAARGKQGTTVPEATHDSGCACRDTEAERW